MLKIKDTVNFDILRNYGFIRKDDNILCKKVYLYNKNDDKNFYEIDKTTREIKLKRLDGELDNTLFDLINAGLVEKTSLNIKCNKTDNSCRDEKLGCNGCYFSKFISNALYGSTITKIYKEKIKEMTKILNTIFNERKINFHYTEEGENEKIFLEFFFEFSNKGKYYRLSTGIFADDFVRNYSSIIGNIIKNIMYV